METAENTLYFNTIRTYTVSLLSLFNEVKQYTNNEALDIPIRFGNYEKSVMLDDITEDQIKTGSINILPRMVLSFSGMSYDPTRKTNKFNKISKKVKTETGKYNINYSYNSVPYNFAFDLLIQARGLNQAFMIVEQIMCKFNPSITLKIEEYPLFSERVETQVTAGDPEFEILQQFEDEDVNVVNISIPLTIKGNLYLPILLTGPIEVVKMMTHLWDKVDYKYSKIASKYEFDVCVEDGKIYDISLEYHNAPEKDNTKEVIEEQEATTCEKNLTTIISSPDYESDVEYGYYTLITGTTREY